MQAVGHIIAGYQHPVSKKFMPVLEQKNLVMYEAADILALLLAGNGEYRVNHMYFQYENTNGAVSVTPTLSRDLGRGSFNSIDGSDDQDWLRLPIAAEPILGKYPDTTSNYEGNAVTFVATSALSSTQEGESPTHNPFGPGDGGSIAPSKIFSLALVASPVPSDSTQDKIFSRINLTTPFTVVAGLHVSVYWIIRFI